MRTEEHEPNNTTTYLDDGIRVHRNKIGLRYVVNIFDKDGILCAANGFNTEEEREEWANIQLGTIRHPNLVQPKLEIPEPKSEITRETEEKSNNNPLLGF